MTQPRLRGNKKASLGVRGIEYLERIYLFLFKYHFSELRTQFGLAGRLSACKVEVCYFEPVI